MSQVSPFLEEDTPFYDDCFVVRKASRKAFLSDEGSKRAAFMDTIDTPSVIGLLRPLNCTIEWNAVESDSGRTRSGWLSLLLDVEIRDEGEANDAIAAGAVGTFDNIDGSGPISVAWRLRSRAWEGKKILSETNGEITENN